MFSDYSTTFQDFLDDDQIEEIILNANNLGLLGFQIVGVYIEEDADGRHLYFEIEG